MRVAGVLTASIFVINIVLHRPFIDALLFSLAIAIGLTPQLLPAIVTVSLSTGSRRLARRKVLVKRLVSIEDLGNITLLFTDKTGTLTEGHITFDRALDGSGAAAGRPHLLGLVCNEALLDDDGKAVSGNALDVALWNAADAPTSTEARQWKHVAAKPFDHERRLATRARRRARRRRAGSIVKGEPESVLQHSDGAPAEAPATLSALYDSGRPGDRGRRPPRPRADRRSPTPTSSTSSSWASSCSSTGRRPTRPSRWPASIASASS